MRLVVATTNPDKLREIRGLLANTPVTLLGLRDFPPIDEPEETGATFAENARLKAEYYAKRLMELRGVKPAPAWDFVVAEDSGLVIDALDGEPGVRSARFVRPEASYPERFAEIYRRLAAHPDRPHTARFVCTLAVVAGACVVFETRGTVEGTIAPEPRGGAGFGYDPIFYYPPYSATLAEVTEEAKLAVAHRGEAFRHLATWLNAAVQTKNGER
jgi:XTP/dITP diphosphohydrolase